MVSTSSWAAAQAGSPKCKFAVRVECDTFTSLPSRILIAVRNYEQICQFYWMTKVQMTCATAGLVSYLSISYLLADLSELLIDRLGSPKCVVAEVSVCSDSFPLKELPNENKGWEDRTRINHEWCCNRISRCSDLFCQFEKVHGYCLQGWYFLVKYKFINKYLLFCLYFCISAIGKLAQSMPILHEPGW